MPDRFRFRGVLLVLAVLALLSQAGCTEGTKQNPLKRQVTQSSAKVI